MGIKTRPSMLLLVALIAIVMGGLVGSSMTRLVIHDLNSNYPSWKAIQISLLYAAINWLWVSAGFGVLFRRRWARKLYLIVAWFLAVYCAVASLVSAGFSHPEGGVLYLILGGILVTLIWFLSQEDIKILFQ